MRGKFFAKILKSGSHKINNRTPLLVFSKPNIFSVFATSHFIQNSAQSVGIFKNLKKLPKWNKFSKLKFVNYSKEWKWQNMSNGKRTEVIGIWWCAGTAAKLELWNLLTPLLVTRYMVASNKYFKPLGLLTTYLQYTYSCWSMIILYVVYILR
jgi:hypothetical protein